MKLISLNIVMVIAISLMAGCAKVTVKKNGDDWDVNYWTLWRAVEDVGAEAGSVKFRLGRAGSDSPISDEVIACKIAPALCK